MKMEPIEIRNIREIGNQFVNADYKSGFSLEIGKYGGITGEEKKEAETLALLIDEAFRN